MNETDDSAAPDALELRIVPYGKSLSAALQVGENFAGLRIFDSWVTIISTILGM